MTPEMAAALRAAFPPEAVGKLPASNNRPPLDYVGHAAVCDRLLQVDPDWTWEPPTSDELQRLPNGDGMWIKLTVGGVTRFGWGDGKNIKEWISDAIRNAAMRFGVALDLWSKEDLHANENAEAGHGPLQQENRGRGGNSGSGALEADSAPGAQGSRPSSASAVSKNKRDALKAMCVALQADGVSVADEREARGLPLVDSCTPEQFAEFDAMVTELEQNLAAPFTKVDA